MDYVASTVQWRRRMIAAGAITLALGALGLPLALAHSGGSFHESKAVSSVQTLDPLVMRHGRAVLREVPVVRVHGPERSPKVGPSTPANA
jgi:hypothetical protein